MAAMHKKKYRDRKAMLADDEYDAKLAEATTFYVGNLSFYTTEEQIYELFSMAGSVKRVVMGLDRMQMTPCGFCFVEYDTREDAVNAMAYISSTKLDNRIIRLDWDIGFTEGRQYGRGRSGGQVRDEFRMNYDEDRGGFGGRAPQKAMEEREREEEPMMLS